MRAAIAVEELVPDDELGRLGLASRDVTCAVRRPPVTSQSKLVQPRE
jgi:hypothetical protein